LPASPNPASGTESKKQKQTSQQKPSRPDREWSGREEPLGGEIRRGREELPMAKECCEIDEMGDGRMGDAARGTV